MNNSFLLNSFLLNSGASVETLDADSLADFILEEMRLALNGKKSSLLMLDSRIKSSVSTVPGKKVLVIDAGGTNLRTCLVGFDLNGKPEISSFSKSSMPGSSGEVSCEEFFNALADRTENLIDAASAVGFCFSYETEILEDNDGVPLSLSKNVKAPSVVGKHLGKELFKVLASRGHDVSGKKVFVLNDTVATLLAGLASEESKTCSGCIGFILGTGTNVAYSEKGRIINTESGRLNFICSETDREFIATTENPTEHVFEKQISGAYLGPLCLFFLKKASSCNLFSEKTSSSLATLETLSTEELGKYLRKEKSLLSDCISGKDDNDSVNAILSSLVNRTALLTACNLAAAVVKSDTDSSLPVLINADGTTFYRVPFLKENTEKHLTEILHKYNKTVIFTRIEDSPVIGSAAAAC